MQEQSADRRRVSVLFIDVVEFTSYAEGADPEQVRALQNDYFTTVRRIIGQYGGVVEKYIGDAAMALFGAPVATENDPLRCVRAALELQRVLPRQARVEAAGLRFRVGIASGEALVDVSAARDGGQAIVAGDVVNSGARLQELAPAGGIFIDENTHAATRGDIEYTEQPPAVLRGRSRPSRMWLDTMISLGSRPMSWQCAASTSRLRANSSGVPPTKFQCCANRAAVRSVRRSPLPPMHTGGCGACTGFGSQRAFVSWKYLPVKSVVSRASRLTMTSHASSNRSLRSAGPPSSMP